MQVLQYQSFGRNFMQFPHHFHPLPGVEIILMLRPRTPKVLRISLMSSASWVNSGVTRKPVQPCNAWPGKRLNTLRWKIHNEGHGILLVQSQNFRQTLQQLETRHMRLKRRGCWPVQSQPQRNRLPQSCDICAGCTEHKVAMRATRKYQKQPTYKNKRIILEKILLFNSLQAAISFICQILQATLPAEYQTPTGPFCLSPIQVEDGRGCKVQDLEGNC